MISVVQQLKDHGICPEILPEISNAIYEAKVVYEGGIEVRKPLFWSKNGRIQVKPGEELAPRQVVQCPTVSWNAEKDTYYTLIFLGENLNFFRLIPSPLLKDPFSYKRTL